MGESVRPAAARIPGGGDGAQPERPTAVDELRGALRDLLATVLDRAFGIALDGVERLAQWFDDVAARGGVRTNALLGGVRAVFGGRNPVWGAVVGAFAGLSPAGRAALILALVLALLLLPLTVVLLLLFLIVAAIVAAVRAAAR